MPHFTTKQDGLFYSYTLPVEQVAKIDEFLSILEDSGIVDIIKNVEKTTGFGRPGFDPYTMFATILYGFAVGSPTLRELENSCRYDLRFKYLMNEATPDHSSFSRFINQYIKPNADAIFSCVVQAYLKRCNLDVDECHIDGTKFEAKSNKYKVVWKPITLHLKLSDKIRTLLAELSLSEGIPIEGIIPANLVAAKLKEASALSAPTPVEQKKLSHQLKVSQRLVLLALTRSAARPRRAVDDRTSPRPTWSTRNHDALGRNLGFGLGIRFRLRESEPLEEVKNAWIIRHPVRVI